MLIVIIVNDLKIQLVQNVALKKEEKKKVVSSGQVTTSGSVVVSPSKAEVAKAKPKPKLTPTFIFEETQIPNSSHKETFDTFESEPKGEVSFNKILGITGIFFLVIFIWFMYWLLEVHSTIARVTETRWNYNVSLFERQIHNGHDWRGSMHTHNFNVVCHSEIRSYHRCNPYQCNPHQESYSCNPRTTCRNIESCRDVCTSNGHLLE